MSNLPADCLNEIFECLEEDKVTLRSCLLVNRLWCEVSVRILWRSIRNYNTLIACLPNESKEILFKNGIIAAISASKPPMLKYASFCKVLSIYQVYSEIIQLQSVSLENLHIVIREIFKSLMSQISSLKKIEFYTSLNVPNFTSFPGAKDCLKNLTEFHCSSDIYPEFFHQLSQICCNIQLLKIYFDLIISDGLADLISAQQNLKHLFIVQFCECEDLTANIITSLTNLPDTLIKLQLYGYECNMQLSFIAKLTNLQEMTLSFGYQNVFESFKELQFVTFPHLQVLKFQYESPRNELLIKFLENNGKNLKEFYVDYDIGTNDNSLNLAIAKFCPNLRKIFTGFRNNEMETLKMIFNSCQYLESIRTWCCGDYISDKEILEVIVKHSPKNYHELNLCYSLFTTSELLPEELESIFADWANHIPLKPISLFIMYNKYSLPISSFNEINENMRIIEKYIKLGIIKEFKTIEEEYCFN